MTTSGTPPGQGSQPNPTAATTGAPTSSPTPTTPDSQPRTPTGQFAANEWRYPADYGVQELRGRTADEAASYFKTFYQQALAGQPRQPQAAPQAQPQPSALPNDTDWLTDPSRAFDRGVQNVVQTQVLPTMNSLFQNNASTNRQLVAQKYSDVFQKWAPEVDALALQLDPQFRTYENYERIAKIVRSDHNDEIVNERLEAAVQARLTASGGSLRSDGSVAAGGSAAPANAVDLGSTELPEEYRRILADVNMKPRDLPEFLRRYYGNDVDLDKAMKDWFEKAKSGKVIAESRAGWRMERK